MTKINPYILAPIGDTLATWERSFAVSGDTSADNLGIIYNWDSMKTVMFLAALLLSSCADFNSPYSSSPPRGGYNDPYNNSGYGAPYGGYRNDDDYYRDRERIKDEERELNRDRRRVEDERRRLDEERRHNNDNQYRPAPPPQRQEPDRCPSGFSPSENKCSTEERRRGCKDMRLPGGLGCVRR